MMPAPQSVLSPAGPDAALLAHFAWLLTAGALLIYLLVAGLVCASVRRRRGRSWSRRLLLGGGLLLPLPVLSALMAWSGWQGTRLVWPYSEARIQVTVIAHMWWWELRYRDSASGREAVLANELRLPAGERVYLALGASDVQHAFWVPALAGKVDMVPGRLHGMTLRAARPGSYRGQCAEFCGTQHAAMALDVTVLAAPGFDAWLAGQARPAANSVAVRGREVFMAARCNACHSVRGVAEGGTAGPDLTHVASRRHIAGGALPFNRAALLGWITNPQAAKPGARMPPSHLRPDELQVLAAWLETLQ